MQDQLSTSLAELFFMNLYLGSITLLIGFVLLLLLLIRNKKLKMNPAFALMSLYVIRGGGLGWVGTVGLLKKMDTMFGPFHLQTIIAVMAIGLILARSFKLTLKKPKPVN